MGLREPLKRGDWLRAETKNGSVIEGQALDSMSMGGYASLLILIQGDGGGSQKIEINVNYWDVSITRKNLL